MRPMYRRIASRESNGDSHCVHILPKRRDKTAHSQCQHGLQRRTHVSYQLHQFCRSRLFQRQLQQAGPVIRQAACQVLHRRVLEGFAHNMRREGASLLLQPLPLLTRPTLLPLLLLVLLVAFTTLVFAAYIPPQAASPGSHTCRPEPPPTAAAGIMLLLPSCTPLLPLLLLSARAGA